LFLSVHKQLTNTLIDVSYFKIIAQTLVYKNIVDSFFVGVNIRVEDGDQED
jgi:hypothetical protein